LLCNSEKKRIERGSKRGKGKKRESGIVMKPGKTKKTIDDLGHI